MKNDGQMMLPIDELMRPSPARSRTKPATGVKKGSTAEKDPATPLMKMVAAKAPNNRKAMKKNFSKEERAEIETKIRDLRNGRRILKEEAREKYAANKRQAKDMEAGNRDTLIVFPSISDDGKWFKLIDFSALYYAYRLAPRMGRKASVMPDTDKTLKAKYAVSLVNIERFIEQIQTLEEGVTFSKTVGGAYLFRLKEPVSDEEYAALYRTEETRREKVHSVLKPKEMAPEIYNAILMLMRSLIPKANKLERNYVVLFGERVSKALQNMLVFYGLATDGVMPKKEAGVLIVKNVEILLAAVTMASELRIWPYDKLAIMSEEAAKLRAMVLKEFVGA